MCNIKVNTTTYSPSGSNFDTQTTGAKCGESVWLTSDPGGSITVYPKPNRAFLSSPSSLTATAAPGTKYTLDAGFKGTVTLSLTDSTSSVTTNGTINVGNGGGGGHDGGHGGDHGGGDRHDHGSHSPA